jgi:hypothetical protein
MDDGQGSERRFNMDVGKVKVFVARRLQLRVQPQLPVDTNHVPLFDFSLHLSAKRFTKAPDGVVILLHQALLGRRGRVEGRGGQRKLCDSILEHEPILDIVNNTNKRHIIDCAWRSLPPEARKEHGT